MEIYFWVPFDEMIALLGVPHLFEPSRPIKVNIIYSKAAKSSVFLSQNKNNYEMSIDQPELREKLIRFANGLFTDKIPPV